MYKCTLWSFVALLWGFKREFGGTRHSEIISCKLALISTLHLLSIFSLLWGASAVGVVYFFTYFVTISLWEYTVGSIIDSHRRYVREKCSLAIETLHIQIHRYCGVYGTHTHTLYLWIHEWMWDWLFVRLFSCRNERMNEWQLLLNNAN